MNQFLLGDRSRVPHSMYKAEERFVIPHASEIRLYSHKSALIHKLFFFNGYTQGAYADSEHSR
jgi:hypothetical protein